MESPKSEKEVSDENSWVTSWTSRLRDDLSSACEQCGAPPQNHCYPPNWRAILEAAFCVQMPPLYRQTYQRFLANRQRAQTTRSSQLRAPVAGAAAAAAPRRPGRPWTSTTADTVVPTGAATNAFAVALPLPEICGGARARPAWPGRMPTWDAVTWLDRSNEATTVVFRKGVKNHCRGRSQKRA